MGNPTTTTPGAQLLADHAEIFSALSEPVRLRILAEIARADEWPCTALEGELSISKSTISYHIKILSRAGLIDVRKEGRNYFYRLRHDRLEDISPTLLQDLTVQAGNAR